MKNKNKKMPKILKFSLFLCFLGIFSGGLLALVNNFTQNIIEENEKKAAYKEIINAGIEENSLIKTEDIQNEAIKELYRAQTTDKIPCYVFVVRDINAFTNVKTIVVVEITTEKVLNIKISPGSTSHDKDSLFENNGFGIVGENLTALEEKFQIVSGASETSKSIKNCLNAVYNELSIMSGKATFKELKQRLPEINHFEYTYIIDEQEVSLLLNLNESTKTFEYVKTISGTIKEEAIVECLALANMNFPKEYIKTVYEDAKGTTLTIVTDRGFKGTIVAEIMIYNNKIRSFVLKESNENYHRNPNYQEKGNVEDKIFKEYDLGSKDYTVTGATVTSKAINQLLLMADQYIKSLGGTNNGK